MGGIINLGNVVRRLGRKINQSGTSVVLCGGDYYEVLVSLTLAPTAAGNVTVTLLQDGTPVQGAVVSETAVAADTSVNVSIPAVVRTRGCSSSVLTLQLTGTEANVTTVAIVVEEK